jgi:hypothetical protein
MPPPVLILRPPGVVAFGIVLIISTIQWFVDGRKNFAGPVSEETLVATNSAEYGNGFGTGHLPNGEMGTVTDEEGNKTK